MRGEPGWDIVPEVDADRGELDHRQAGQGRVLRHRTRPACCATAGITHIILTGITTDVCVHTTMREANDRGYECLLLSRLHRRHRPGNYQAALKMVHDAGRACSARSRRSSALLASLWRSTPWADDIPYTITGLLDGYRSRRFAPREVIDIDLARLVASGDRAVWIGDPDPERMTSGPGGSGRPASRGVSPRADPAGSAVSRSPSRTTSMSPGSDHGRVPGVRPTVPAGRGDAVAVDRLLEAGAVLVGKTNLDQFATGLVGTRGRPTARCTTFDQPGVHRGGTSSGSASRSPPASCRCPRHRHRRSGRVPAAFNGIVG